MDDRTKTAYTRRSCIARLPEQTNVNPQPTVHLQARLLLFEFVQGVLVHIYMLLLDRAIYSTTQATSAESTRCFVTLPPVSQERRPAVDDHRWASSRPA